MKLALLFLSALALFRESVAGEDKKATGKKQKQKSKRKSPLQSVGKIQVGDDVLFVADWKQNEIFAFELPPITETPDTHPYTLNIVDLQAKLGLKEDVALEGLAHRAGTYDVIVALSIGEQAEPLLAIFHNDESNESGNNVGSYEILNLEEMAYTSAELNKPPKKEDLWFYKPDDPVEQYVVTDMEYHNGKLYAAGLGDYEAASVMRVYDYPFTGEHKTVSIITYNIAHTQWEIRAPFRHFIIETVDLEQWSEDGLTRLGKKPTEVIVAALLCTPMAYIPLSLISDADEEQVVKARAIAEIGDGGTPLDVVKYTGSSFSSPDPVAKLMVVELYRNTKIIPWETILAAMNASPEGITCGKNGSPWVFDGFENGDSAGMDFGIIGPYVHMIYMEDMTCPDGTKGCTASPRLVGLRRDIKSGKVNLLGALPLLDGTRLTDMTIEEYWWNSYDPEKSGFNQKVLTAQYDSMPFEGYPDAIPTMWFPPEEVVPNNETSYCNLPYDEDDNHRSLNVAARAECSADAGDCFT